MFKLNLLIVFYLILVNFVLLLAKVKHKNHRVFFKINIFVLAWEAWLLYHPADSGILKIIEDWTPLLLLPLLHQETELLTTAFKSKTHDSKFIQFEDKYFPYIMRIHQKNLGSSLYLSEFLHACYLSFYFLIYGIPLYFYLNHQLEYYYQSLFVIILTLCSSFITHGLIPVSGPRNLFEKIQDHRSNGFFFRLVHIVLEKGSTYATAFPSGHTGIACAVMFITFYIAPTVFYVILPFAIGLIVSTVYGRFHYVSDAIAGFFYALIAFLITISIY